MDRDECSDLSLGLYYKLVWRRAKALENWDWLTRVGGSIVPIAIGAAALILFGAVDSSALISTQRIGWVFLGASLLLGGLGRMAWCLIRAPHSLYIEERRAFSARLESASEEFDRQRSAGSVLI
jgi:hypothetical protein